MRRTIRVLGCCVLSLCASGCASLRDFHAQPATSRHATDACPAELDSVGQRLLDSAVNEHGLVGAQVSLAVGDGVRCQFASGTADLDRRQPLLPGHVIRLGSLTKTYTAVVVLRLIERGLVGLDSPVSRWFPEYRFARRITVRMLLDHSSGLRELLGPRVMFLSTIRSTRVWTTAELLAMVFKPPLEFEPGSDHRYSNSNYVLLGILAERATGRTLQTLYREEIFTPLGLQHTWFLPFDKAPGQLVVGFDRDLIPLPGWHTTTPHNAAWSSLAHASGAMAATASDVMRLFEAVMNREVVGEDSYRVMTSVARARHPEDTYLERFGLGLFRYGDVYRNTYGHIGLFVGSETIALFDPARKSVFVLLANVSRIRNRDLLVQRYLDAVEGYVTGNR